MIKVTTAAMVFLAAGIFTSVTILSAFQIFFGISLIFYCYLAIKEKQFKLPVSAYWLIAFSLIACVSLFLNLEIVPKPSKNFGKIKYFLFGVGGIFVFKYWLTQTSDQVKRNLLNLFFVSIMIAGAWCIYERAVTIGRIKTLTETMRYGYGTVMVLTMILTSFLYRDKTSRWVDLRFAIPAFILGWIGVYFTGIRGAVVGFACALPIIFIFYRPKWGLITSGIVLVLGLFLMNVYFFGDGTSSNRFLYNKKNSSDRLRFSQWAAASKAIEERPLKGWGFSNFHTQVERIKNTYDIDKKDYIDTHAHNLFLEVMAGTGLFGLIAFLGWLISWAWEVFKAGGLIRVFIIPFGIVYIVASQFEVTLDANNSSLLFALYGISLAAREFTERENV